LPSLGLWGLAFLRNSSQARYESSFLKNVRISSYSQSVMAALLLKHPLQFEHTTDGTLQIFRQTKGLEDALKVAHFLKQVQIRHRALSREELIEFEPALAPIRDDLSGGITYPDDEVGNARLFCEELYRVTKRAGVEFRFSEQVLRFEQRRKSITGVVTARERLQADAYVLATGSYSTEFTKQMGFRLPVRPAKGYSLTLPIDESSPRPRYAVIDDELHAAVVPLGESLRIAGTAEFTGFDQSVNSRRIANLQTLLKRIYPEFGVSDQGQEAWSGLRPMTPDGMPILGASPLANLFLNTGHGPLGWTMACGSGKIVADRIMKKHPEFDGSAYGYDRF
ncbi:MAG: FAD-dependent oxidoreductase, partial [Gammaproteobacteria bacterium]|nr:FAD-dependent oxidoreductase [Gammaproteobacteria bacterium]